MKVDILVPIGEKGGVENVINMVAPYLQEKGIEVRVVQLIWEGVPWVTEKIPFYALMKGLSGHTLFEMIEQYAAFLQKTEVPDVILATALPSMCDVARRVVDYLETDTLIISWMHTQMKFYMDAGYGNWEYLAMADAHFAISQEIYEDIMENLPEAHIEYTFNPVDFDKCVYFEKQKQENPIKHQHRLYSIGRVDEVKRQDLMICAVAASPDWDLYIIGDDGNFYGKKMKQLTKQLNVENRVHWFGWQKNPWEIVEEADAVILASEHEGYPLAAIEAQANGLPVISTPTSGITDLISIGKNGYIFPFGDWEALAGILQNFSKNKLLYPAAYRQHVMNFEKDIASEDFYGKIMKLWERLKESPVLQNTLQKTQIGGQEEIKLTRQQIYQTNAVLQSTIHQIISACHVQNYDKAIRSFTDMNGNLMLVLEAGFSDLSFYNQETEVVNPDGVSMALNDMLTAQECGDYVLFADLLELQLVPFLQSIQEAIRTYDVASAEPDCWTRNMDMLEKTNRVLWNQLLKYHERYEKENTEGIWQGIHHLEDTNSGAYTMTGQDEKGMYYYHSNVDPMKEAAEFARYYYNTGSDSYVVWGLGLGYHVREMMFLDSGISLSVYESDLDVIYHCLMSVDMTICMVFPGFSIHYDPDFKEIIGALENLKENFILHYPSLRHIEDVRIREQMEMFFIRDSGKRNAEILFESNSRENLKNYDGYVDELKASFEGKKAVIVAAGPSLDKNVELLKNKSSDMIILATGTVFRKLINLGIDVDYVMVTDANSRVYHQIAGYETYQVPMLYLSTAYKGFSMNYQGRKYLICQKGYDKAEEIAGKNGWHLYETGGSVSTTALDVCITLGCKEIAFIGLDLAYTDNLAHAEGTSRREAAEASELRKVPAVGGGTVPVSRVFMIYNKWIENRVKKSDVTMTVVDATEGGAIVQGLKVMALKDFIER